MRPNKRIRKFLLFVFFLFFSVTTFSQNLFDFSSIQPDSEFENVLAKQIYSDSNSTSFIIWVKKEVKTHYHATHTEQIVVLEGEALMMVGDEMIQLKPGVMITVPEKTNHSVQVMSDKPLKILSVQSPMFDGKDRVWVED